MSAGKTYYSSGAAGLLAPLQGFLDDSDVSEILINKAQEVFVERLGAMLRFEIPALSTPYLRRLFTLIANENRQILSETIPILSGHLYDGSRVQLVIPTAAQHETLSIRKFTLNYLGFEDYARQGFFTGAQSRQDLNKTQEATLQQLYKAKDWSSFLSKAILYKKTILISGGTSSGKTTFLNSCIHHIPRHERIITLEDTFEINAPHPNQVRLKALKSVGDKTNGVSMQDLVQASLRLRPDRIIMGEIRGREVFDFVSACSTGHSGSLATIHANSPQVALMRMAQLYKLNPIANMEEKDIYNILQEVIDIVVQLAKTDEGRRLVEVYYKGVH
jgi:type IV secretion system protein VirB11